MCLHNNSFLYFLQDVNIYKICEFILCTFNKAKSLFKIRIKLYNYFIKIIYLIFDYPHKH